MNLKNATGIKKPRWNKCPCEARARGWERAALTALELSWVTSPAEYWSWLKCKNLVSTVICKEDRSHCSEITNPFSHSLADHIRGCLLMFLAERTLLWNKTKQKTSLGIPVGAMFLISANVFLAGCENAFNYNWVGIVIPKLYETKIHRVTIWYRNLAKDDVSCSSETSLME